MKEGSSSWPTVAENSWQFHSIPLLCISGEVVECLPGVCSLHGRQDGEREKEGWGQEEGAKHGRREEEEEETKERPQ